MYIQVACCFEQKASEDFYHDNFFPSLILFPGFSLVYVKKERANEVKGGVGSFCI